MLDIFEVYWTKEEIYVDKQSKVGFWRTKQGEAEGSTDMEQYQRKKKEEENGRKGQVCVQLLLGI